MKAKLVVNNVETELDFKELELTCRVLSDSNRHLAVFDELAKSESEAIRALIAGKKVISKETINLLAKDTCEEVLSELISNDEILPFLEKNCLNRILDVDNEDIRWTVAFFLERFTHLIDITDLAETLLQKGPKVRLALAQNNLTPFSVLMKLKDDKDIKIAEKASRVLKIKT